MKLCKRLAGSLCFFLSLGVLSIGCGSSKSPSMMMTGTPDASSTTGNPDGGSASTPTLADVVAIINANCTICHAGSSPTGMLDMTNFYSATVNVAANEDMSLDYIKPGDLGHSYLWCKLQPMAPACVSAGTMISGSQMPLG